MMVFLVIPAMLLLGLVIFVGIPVIPVLVVAGLAVAAAHSYRRRHPRAAVPSH